MTNVTSEIKRTSSGHVPSGKAVLFDIRSQYSAAITYEAQTGEIIFDAPGIYSVKWWVATETAPRGTVEFMLAFSYNGVIEYIPGCSPIKTGQVSGYGTLDVKAAGAKLSLINNTGVNTVFAENTETKAYLTLMRIDSEHPDGPIGVYHANLSTSGSSLEVTVGHVVYRVQYSTASALALYVRSTGEPITVDIKRSSQVDSAYNGSTLDNYSLTTSPQNIDASILANSNEMHRTWIRQKDPDSGLWSLYEVQLFPSANKSRVSVSVYLVYENIDLNDL